MSRTVRPVIVVAESNGFPPGARQRLEEVGELRLADLDRAGLLRAVGDAHVLWVRLRHRIDEEVLAAAPRLRVVATPTTGLTHIDLEAAARRGIQVLSLRGALGLLRDIRSTAEHTILLMLALLRRLPAAVDHVGQGGWDRDLFHGAELYRRTVGVVGHGRLGRIVSRYLLAFEARVLTTDPAVGADDVEPGVTWAPFSDLLAQSDIVTLHVDVRPETYRFFDASCFAAMRRGALFINTSRGELVDETALSETLRIGHLGGAALDVLAGEDSSGMGHHPLVRYAQENKELIITPHIGGNTEESRSRVELWLAGRLANRLNELLGVLPPDGEAERKAPRV